MCFKDASRLCNAACMAYLTTVPKGPDYIGEQWAHCLELVSLHRSGKHLALIASSVSTEQAASRRAQQAPGVG